MARLKTPLLLVVALALLAVPASSQDRPAKDGMWTFTPDPQGIELESLVKVLEENTGATVLYDPASPQVRGRRIFIEGTVRIPRDRIFQWVRSVLSYHRLVLVPNGPRHSNGWALVDVNSPMVCSRPEYVAAGDLPQWEDADGAYIVTTVSLAHLDDTARARNALAQISTRQVGRINDVPQSRSFVIADFAPVVHSMWKMLCEMDAEAANRPARAEPVRQEVPAAPADPAARLRKEIESYEMKLVGSRTSHAAQYFLNLIQELRAKLQKLEPGGD